VVVDHVEHLEDGAVVELDVGHVGLPPLVGQVGAEADEGALGPLVGLRGDEPSGLQDPPNGRDRGHLGVALGEVVVDRLGPGVVAGVDELLAQRHHLVLVEVGDPRGRALRAPAPRHQPGLAFEAIAPQQLEEPAGADPMRASQLLDGTARP
jgi:hypothetical protein